MYCFIQINKLLHFNSQKSKQAILKTEAYFHPISPVLYDIFQSFYLSQYHERIDRSMTHCVVRYGSRKSSVSPEIFLSLIRHSLDASDRYNILHSQTMCCGYFRIAHLLLDTIANCIPLNHHATYVYRSIYDYFISFSSEFIVKNTQENKN